MTRPKFQIVAIDEVKISREGEHAIFSYADDSMGGWNIKIGPQVQNMSDQGLLDFHNNLVLTMEANRREYEHVAVEIPVGKLQIEYDQQCSQWIMRGDVLRCFIASARNSTDGQLEPAIEIDDKTLSWKEFGKLLVFSEGTDSCT